MPADKDKPKAPTPPSKAENESAPQSLIMTTVPVSSESKSAEPKIPPPSEDIKDEVVSEPQEQSEEVETTSSKNQSRLYVFGIVVAVIALVATIVLLYIRAQQAIDGQNKQEVAEEVTEEPTPTPEPTPIPKSDITIDVLNGSGISGLAGTTADTFKDLGYEILEIGNADSIEGNQIYINPDIDEDLLSLLFEDLEDELDISSSSGELKDSTASAQIILGK